MVDDESSKKKSEGTGGSSPSSGDTPTKPRQAVSPSTPVVPQTLMVEVHMVVDPAATPHRHELSSQGITLNLHQVQEPKTLSSRISAFVKDLGPPLVAAAALYVSFVAYQVNERQAKATEADLRGKILPEFQQATEGKSTTERKTAEGKNTTEEKREEEKRVGEEKVALTAIRLADYGESALPTIEMMLGAEQNDIRRYGVLAGAQMFRTAPVSDQTTIQKRLSNYFFPTGRIQRENLLNQLKTDLRSENPSLRRGVMQLFAELQHEVSNKESGEIVDLVKERLGAQAQKCVGEDQFVVLEETNFLVFWPSLESKDLLLGIVTNCSYGEARKQAAINLRLIAKNLTVSEKQALADVLKNLPVPPSSKLGIEIKETIDDLISKKVP